MSWFEKREKFDGIKHKRTSYFGVSLEDAKVNAIRELIAKGAVKARSIPVYEDDCITWHIHEEYDI